jgi:hypothetical protein
MLTFLFVCRFQQQRNFPETTSCFKILQEPQAAMSKIHPQLKVSQLAALISPLFSSRLKIGIHEARKFMAHLSTSKIRKANRFFLSLEQHFSHQHQIDDVGPIITLLATARRGRKIYEVIFKM